jgi:hypothetical protein
MRSIAIELSRTARRAGIANAELGRWPLPFEPAACWAMPGGGGDAWTSGPWASFPVRRRTGGGFLSST